MAIETVKELGGLIKVRVKAVGLTPLLVNRMPEETLLALRDPTQKKSRNASKPTPREEADTKVYVDANRRPYLPVKNIMSCLIAAGQFVRLDGKRQVSTAQKTVLPGFLTPTEMTVNLLDSKGKPSSWEVDVQAGRNPNGGEAVCIVRPRFDEWSFTTEFNIDTTEIEEKLMRNLFDIAGSRVGLGDFRPARKGTYGCWRVECWERVELADNPRKSSNGRAAQELTAEA